MFHWTRRVVKQKVLPSAGFVLAVFTLAFTASGCGDDKQPAEQGSEQGSAQGSAPTSQGASAETGSSIDILDSGRGNTLYNPNDRKVVIVRSNSELADFVKARPRWRAPNFSERQIVGVFLDTSGGGEQIRVDAVSEQGGSTLVKVTHRVPGKNCITDSRYAPPFAVVSTSRTTGNPKLKITRAAVDC